MTIAQESIRPCFILWHNIITSQKGFKIHKMQLKKTTGTSHHADAWTITKSHFLCDSFADAQTLSSVDEQSRSLNWHVLTKLINRLKCQLIFFQSFSLKWAALLQVWHKISLTFLFLEKIQQSIKYVFIKTEHKWKNIKRKKRVHSSCY